MLRRLLLLLLLLLCLSVLAERENVYVVVESVSWTCCEHAQRKHFFGGCSASLESAKIDLSVSCDDRDFSNDDADDARMVVG